MSTEARGAPKQIISKGRPVTTESMTWGETMSSTAEHTSGQVSGAKPGVADTTEFAKGDTMPVDTSVITVDETYTRGFNRWDDPEPGGEAGKGKVVMRESRNRRDAT